MFTVFYWRDYLLTATSLTAAYYLAVGLRFYRSDISSKFRKGTLRKKSQATKFSANNLPEVSSSTFTNDPRLLEEKAPAWQNEEMFERVEALSDHLKSLIAEAFEKEYDKSELLLLLQMTLRDYTSIKDTPFQLAINNVITTQCARYGSIHLGENDEVMIWNQVE